MKISEITRPHDHGFAADHLIKSGYTPMGSGSNAQVVAKSDSRYVVKLFSTSDRSYLTFLKLIQANPSEHFPKIYGKPYRVNDQYYAVRIEKLSKLDDA